MPPGLGPKFSQGILLKRTLFLILLLAGCGPKPFSSADFLPFDGEVHPNSRGHFLMAEAFLAQLQKNKREVYCALGDSVTHFTGDKFHPTYAEILANRAGFKDKKILGIGFANTLVVIDRELPEVPDGADFVTLFVGLNDLVKTNPSGPPDALHPFGCNASEGMIYSHQFKKRIQIILKALTRKKSKQILIANLYDFTNGRGFTKWGWPDGLKVLEQYNDRLAELAKENQIGLVDLHRIFSVRTERYFNNPRWDQPPRRWTSS